MTRMARKSTTASRAAADISARLDLVDAQSSELLGVDLKLDDSHLRDLDLSGREFSTLKLSGCLLENVSLSNCTVRLSVFRDVRFKGCNLSNAVLRGNQSTRLEWVHCRLTGFKAIECNWRDVLVEGCDARYAQFNDASVRISEFKALSFRMQTPAHRSERHDFCPRGLTSRRSQRREARQHRPPRRSLERCGNARRGRAGIDRQSGAGDGAGAASWRDHPIAEGAGG